MSISSDIIGANLVEVSDSLLVVRDRLGMLTEDISMGKVTVDEVTTLTKKAESIALDINKLVTVLKTYGVKV